MHIYENFTITPETSADPAIHDDVDLDPDPAFCEVKLLNNWNTSFLYITRIKKIKYLAINTVTLT